MTSSDFYSLVELPRDKDSISKSISNEAKTVFENLELEISNSPARNDDDQIPFVVETDASDFALPAAWVLRGYLKPQEQPDASNCCRAV